MVGPKEQEPPGWLRCEIEENLEFNTTDLESRCLANGDDGHFDALVLMAAIQFCDRTKIRSANIWNRNLTLNIPVHDPDLWNSEAVSKSLLSAIQFVTGDQWKIEFRDRKLEDCPPKQKCLELPKDIRAVLPFSEGLDSLAVADLLEPKYGDQLLQVRLGPKHRTGQMNGGRRNYVVSVPFKFNSSRKGPSERSFRSRGFIFALLCGNAASLSNATKIHMPESGQGVIGPVLVISGQGHPDFRNHPQFARKMEIFIEALFDWKVLFCIPRLWHTKGETIKDYLEAGGSKEELLSTRSCWRGQRHASVLGKLRQCGICAACLLRRMSLHACEITESEDTYVIEDLNASELEQGAAVESKPLKYGNAYEEDGFKSTLYFQYLANFGDSQTTRNRMAKQAAQLSKVLGIPVEECQCRLKRLLEQHEKEWSNFVEALGPMSFIAKWISGVKKHVPYGIET